MNSQELAKFNERMDWIIDTMLEIGGKTKPDICESIFICHLGSHLEKQPDVSNEYLRERMLLFYALQPPTKIEKQNEHELRQRRKQKRKPWSRSA